MAFSADSEVEVRATGDVDWELLHEIKYQGKWQHFSVPIGVGTDFASVPTVFVWFLPKYGRYTKAAILHDYLWRHQVPAEGLTLPEADALFRRAMRELDVSFLRRWIMWSAVRLGALTKSGGRRRWLRDSWMVFPVALVALPVIGPPAVLILASLFLFHILELLFYVPLKLVASVKARRPQAPPPKEVNVPQLTLKLG
ncbi:MAG: DUF1353 domain-containing protein [Actinomycetota bacterium]